MHRFVLLLGLGTALVAADACVQRPETPLTQAAARNDVAAIRRLLDDGHEADEGGDSWTALIWASRTGSIEAIKLLLGKGTPLAGRLLTYDSLKMKFRDLKLRKDPGCPVCGDKPTIKSYIDYEGFCAIG